MSADTQSKPRTILVAVDGSDSAKRAFQEALRICQPDDQIILLSVIDISNVTLEFLDLTMKDENQNLLQKLADKYTKLLEDYQVIAKHSGFKHVTSRIERGNPRERIVEEAYTCHADLVIIGNRGLGKVKSLLLGSVSEFVIRNCTCNVYVAK